MAAILTNHDLEDGEIRSSVISDATKVELQTLLNTVVGRVRYIVEKKQGSGNWISVKDENGNAIELLTVNSIEEGLNIQGLGGSSFSIRVIPVGTVTGILSIDVITDGTIA